MHINRLSLLNSLFSVFNENPQGDSNYVLARYFLEHYHELDKLNIYDVAADCFVSRSSVRRFCQSIGYDNFLDLKTEFRKYDDQRSYYLQHADRPDYRQALTREINEMIEELDRRMDADEENERLIDLIHSARYVVFLTSDASTSTIRDFQQSMLFLGKIIRLISDAYTDNELVNSMEESDLLITLSASGTFAYAARDYVEHCKAQKLLFTVNRDPVFKKYYDHVYHLSAQDRSNESHSVYGRYGMSYMFDILYSQYLRKYGAAGH